MIWGTSIWRLGCSNRSKIRSAQKCYLCLRYVVSPMSPGRTLKERARPGRFELPTSCFGVQLSNHGARRMRRLDVLPLSAPVCFIGQGWFDFVRRSVQRTDYPKTSSVDLGNPSAAQRALAGRRSPRIWELGWERFVASGKRVAKFGKRILESLVH
jgi:hypothetical protein